MELLNLKYSNSTGTEDISNYNQVIEQQWFLVFGIIVCLAIIVVALCFLKKYIEGPHYQKANRLEGKVVIITGCNRGIGRETALEMANRGARVYMACRNFDKCEKIRLEIIKATKNNQVFNRTLDLASLQSVRKFVQQFLKEEEKLDILINNAAILSKTRQLSNDGYELQFATNYLGHFLLTYLLLDILKSSAPSRVVVVTSSPYIWPILNKQDLQSEKSFFWPKAFLQSKFCNTLFTLKLAEVLHETKVTVNCFYPGVVRTDLLYKNTWRLIHPLLKFFAKSPKSGAQNSFYLSMDPELEEKTGGFYHNMQKCYVPPWSRNPNLALWLWQESLKMVGLETI